MEAIRGDIVYSKSKDELTEHRDSYLVFDDSKVVGIYDILPEEYENIKVTELEKGSVIIPAFSDNHVHAPQYTQRGLGMDAILSDWLSRYTFPEESKFESLEYADKVYTAFVDDMLRNGTLHAAIYATIHPEATDVLYNKLKERNMSALVGKINMDMNSPDYLTEDTEESICKTEGFLESHIDKKVKPIITPRFAPTCSDRLLKGLGKLTEKYNCAVQTHLVESIWEAAEAVRLYPDCSCDTEIYEKAGLLGHGPVLFGHVIFPSENDLQLIEKYNCICVHCPDATTNVIAGIAPVGMLLDRGLRVTIGTDVGAGQALPVYRQIARTVQLSKLKEFYEPNGNRTVGFSEAFYMATKEGGSVYGKVGSFEKDYTLDALVICGMSDEWADISPKEKIERFCYTGDDRNISQKYIDGKRT